MFQRVLWEDLQNDFEIWAEPSRPKMTVEDCFDLRNFLRMWRKLSHQGDIAETFSGWKMKNSRNVCSPPFLTWPYPQASGICLSSARAEGGRTLRKSRLRTSSESTPSENPLKHTFYEPFEQGPRWPRNRTGTGNQNHRKRFSRNQILKFRRVTIRGAQPSASLSEEICLSEGSAGVSPRVPRGLSEGSAGLCGGPRDFPRVFGGTDPMLVTLGKCWTKKPPEPFFRNRNQNRAFLLSFKPRCLRY